MSSVFLRFEPPPLAGWVTVAERDCTFQVEPVPGGSGEDGSATITNVSSHTTEHAQDVPYQSVWVEPGEGVAHSNGSVGAFLPCPDDNHWKVAWNILWRNEGIYSALESLQAKACTLGEATPLSLKMAAILYSAANRMLSLYGNIVPQSQMSLTDVISEYSSLPNWSDSIVRAVALHPRLDYFALARQDDELDVRSLTNPEYKVVLKDRQQVGVACMQWAPHNDNLLAVGASTGLLLWHVDPNSPTTRFVTTWVRFECSPGHTPISSLSWSPWGHFIASSSPRDTHLLLWNIPLGVATRVWRGKGRCIAKVTWSPEGRRVFTGNVDSVFRIWETGNWSCERWTNFSGRCKSACWGPDGKILIFSLKDDPSLYYLSFHGNEVSTTGPSSAIKCADLSPCCLHDDDDEAFVGGTPRDVVWDSRGQRLAVTFTMDSPSAKLVAIFRTSTGSLLQLQPGGFVQGLPDEYPNIISFKDDYSHGALLMVAWSSGRVSFLPLYFQDPTSSISDRLPEVVPNHTPHPPDSSLLGQNTTLSRPSLYRRNDSSLLGTTLYSVHA